MQAISISAGIDPRDLTQITGNRYGWTVGGGVEHQLAANWSWKIEYLYMDFSTPSSTNLDLDTYNHRNTLHTAKIGINYRFGDFGKGPVVAGY